jgi:NADH-quinone oxidoreductase subunit N
MTHAGLLAILPLLVLSGGTVVVLLAAAFLRHHGTATGLTLVTLGASAAALLPAAQVMPRSVTPLLVLDGYALYYLGLLFATAFAVALLGHGYLARREEQREEFYVLLLTATVGSAVLVMSSHFASFFLGLEVLSVSLYGLVAYPRERERSVEAGIKYLVLAGTSSAFLLFGMALIYTDLGSLGFRPMSALLASSAARPGASALVLPGLALIVVGVGFKLALVPFHMWTPDVYEGAPAPVTAFLATASKGAMFALVLRYFRGLGDYGSGSILLVFTLIAIASMLTGNLLALLQRNVKRILAYSSIGHLGYLLVAFLAAGDLAAGAVTFYLTAYFVTTLIAFGVVSVVSEGGEEADDIDDYRGLYWRRPWLAALMTAALFSLAGIPLTAGFLGKYYVLAAGVQSSLWILALVLVVSSVIGLFYYLRVVVAMVSPPSEAPTPGAAARVPVAGGLALAVLAVLVVWFGVYPAPLIHVIQTAVAGLS